MGRRKNNPALVEELIDHRWDMDDDEFEEKYNSLSSSDKSLVGEAIDGMEAEWMTGVVPEGCSACGNPVYPNCTDACPIME